MTGLERIKDWAKNEYAHQGQKIALGNVAHWITRVQKLIQKCSVKEQQYLRYNCRKLLPELTNNATEAIMSLVQYGKVTKDLRRKIKRSQIRRNRFQLEMREPHTADLVALGEIVSREHDLQKQFADLLETRHTSVVPEGLSRAAEKTFQDILHQIQTRNNTGQTDKTTKPYSPQPAQGTVVSEAN